MTTIFTDDFNPGGTTWNSTNWNTTVTGTSATIDISIGRGRQTMPNGSGRAVFGYDKYSAMENAEVLVKFEGMGSTRNSFSVIGVACSGFSTKASIMSHGVWLKIPMNGNVTVQHTHSGSATQAGDLGINIGATSTNYWIRLKHNSGTIYVKIWQDGTGEPGAWTATYDISGFASIPAGNLLLGTETTSSTTSGGSVYFDDLTYGDGAASIVNVNPSADAATASALAVDPVVTALPRKIATNFDNNVDPFAAATNGATHTASSGDLVVTVPNSGNWGAALSNFAFTTGGEMLMHVVSASAGDQVGFAFGGAGSAHANASNSWVRARHNGTNVQYKKWADNTTEPTAWTTGGTGTVTSTGSIWGVHTGSSGTITIDYFAANESASVAFPDAVISAEAATATAVMPSAVASSSKAANVVVDGAGTASGELVYPVFSNVTNKTVTAPVATGSGLAVSPSVSVTRNIEVLAEPATASALMPAGGGFSVPVTVPVDVATGSGEAVDASVAAERNAVVSVPAMGGSALLVAPVEAQVETDDPYFNWIAMTTDSDDYWYRLDETSGTSVASRYTQDTRDDTADLVGTYSFGVFGPEGRKAIHMENGYFRPRSSRQMAGDSRWTDSQGGVHSISGEFTFEVVMRTTDQNGIIAYGLDNYFQAPAFRNAIYLKNGKVTVNSGRVDIGDMSETQGFKNVADGQWHHIVVTQGYGNPKTLDNGFRVYIDGKLDIRRTASGGSLWATPDSYFGMPQAWRDITPFYPWVDNLTADVMEVVVRVNQGITQDTAIELFYAATGVYPIRVEAATASGVMPDAKGKGNQKRVLVLYTDRITVGSTAHLIGDERNSRSSWDTKIPDEFDHDIQIGRIYEPGESPWIDLAGFRVVAVPIMREEGNPLAGPYRDVVTDLPRLINLQDDIDLDEIDVIMFRNWPDEGAELEVFANRGYEPSAIDDFLASVKQAVVDGKGLEVTNINLAFRLGLIGGAQPIPMLYDKKTGSFGERDLRGDAVSPFPAGGEIMLDLHANNWHRVTAQVPNLTDIDSEYIAEVFSTYNDGLDGRVTNNWGYKLEQGPLAIGMEIMDPVVFWNRIKTFIQEGAETEWVWDKYVWAVTPNGLLAGTAVYKFNNKMWSGNTEVDNPYKDFIGAAVVQPGDVWGGVRIAGKVFMNFAEAPIAATRTGAMTRQIVPANSQLPNPNDHETEEMREWDYSYTRILYSATGGAGANQQFELVQGTDGSLTYRITGGRNGAVVGVNITEKYETEQVLVLSWAMRGLAWLANTESAPVGSVIIRPTAITATGSFPEPAVLAQRDATVNAEAAIALSVLVNPAEVEDPDVTIYPFPATGTGVMTGYGKTITVEPFEGSGELVDNFELVAAKGEQAVVFLHGLNEVELYLMEGIK